MGQAPAWFKWIRPAPLTPEETRVILEGFQGIVSKARSDASSLDLATTIRDQREQARQFRNAVKALLDLPATFRDSELIQGIREDFSHHADWSEAFVREYGRTKRGRPLDWAKAACWLECFEFLSANNKDITPARGGTVPGLAQAAWFEATGETYSLDAWAETGKRCLPKLFEAYRAASHAQRNKKSG